MARYNTIGKNYDYARKADPFLAERMFQLLKSDQENAVYLDIGCGTGNYTSALYQKGLNLIGIDPSEEMLSKAKSKTPAIDWRIGTAENIDLEDESVNGVMIGLTIHHWKDLNKGFKEVYRVLKPGGKALIFTSLPEQTRSYWLRHYFPQLIDDSADVLPSMDRIQSALANASLNIINKEMYNVQPDIEDLFLYCGKHEPERYFDEGIRNGISSFSLIGLQDEINNGLSSLRKDIDDNKIEQVINQYPDSLGDYLFISTHKR